MTFLECVNAVLRRLREETVATYNENEYSTLIAQMVNEAKAEVEDAWNWTTLRTFKDVTLVTSTDVYSITGTGQGTRILDAYYPAKKWVLGFRRNNVYGNWIDNVTTLTGSPTEYDIVDRTPGGVLQVRVRPVPTADDNGNTLRFYCVIPQDELDDDATVIAVDPTLVVQGAYLRAINERGEDQGRLSEIQQQMYLQQLGSAISRDAERYADETTWHPI